MMMEVYYTTSGQYTRKLVGSTARLAFNSLIFSYSTKYGVGGVTKKAGCAKKIKMKLKEYFWKTEDIDSILLAGLDEGIRSSCLDILLRTWNPYRYNKFQ
jgi:hypothetical protein